MGFKAALLPASYYLLLAIGLGLCLYLFVTLKHEIWRLENQYKKRLQALEGALRQMRAEAEDLTVRLQEAEEREELLVPPTPPRSGLNLSKRTQALRMFLRGESPEQIAAALSIPEGEVQLLLKVQRIVSEQPQPSATSDP
jgi:hypothetical protein